jgi:hypothetical protein
MASKVTKKQSLSAKGILFIDNGELTLDVEDVETPMLLADLLESFNGQEIQISVNHSDEVV